VEAPSRGRMTMRVVELRDHGKPAVCSTISLHSRLPQQTARFVKAEAVRARVLTDGTRTRRLLRLPGFIELS
jgi:hypothetical protein